LDVHEVATLLLLSYETVGIVFINFCQITGMAEHTHPDYDSHAAYGKSLQGFNEKRS